MFARGQEIAAKQGLILVDTKYEFGVDDDGQLRIADEIHTPDSSRYWIAETYTERFAKGQDPEGLDKEFVRKWLDERMEDNYTSPIPKITDADNDMFSQKYAELYKRVTGETFSLPNSDLPVMDRIENNLKPEL